MVIITKNVKEIIVSFLFLFISMVTLSPSYAQNMNNFTNSTTHNISPANSTTHNISPANSTTHNSTLSYGLTGDLRVKPNSSNDEDFLCSIQYQRVSAGYSFDQDQAQNIHIYKDHYVKIGSLVGWTLGAYNTGSVPVDIDVIGVCFR
jgi:hypothetical protein